MERTVEQDCPRIYVACLAAYNGGRLHGKWIDLDEDTDLDTLWDKVKEVLKTSPEAGAEAWAIHDYEGFEGYSVSESEDFETLIKIAEALRKHGAAFGAYLENEGDLDTALENFEEAYAGEYDSRSEFGQQLFDDTVDISAVPDYLRNYIDVEAWTRDLFLGGDYYDVQKNGSTYVFRNI